MLSDHHVFVCTARRRTPRTKWTDFALYLCLWEYVGRIGYVHLAGPSRPPGFPQDESLGRYGTGQPAVAGQTEPHFSRDRCPLGRRTFRLAA